MMIERQHICEPGYFDICDNQPTSHKSTSKPVNQLIILHLLNKLGIDAVFAHIDQLVD